MLRYLTDAWRTLDRSLPDDVYTDALEDVVEWLGELIRATDATLLDEWTLLAGRPVHDHLAPEAPGAARGVPAAGVAHCGAHRGVRLGRAAGHPGRRGAGRAQRLERATTCARRWRRTGTEYDAHRHRRRRPVGGAVRDRRGAGPVGGHPTPGRPGRRRRVALRRRRRPRAGPSRGRPDAADRNPWTLLHLSPDPSRPTDQVSRPTTRRAVSSSVERVPRHCSTSVSAICSTSTHPAHAARPARSRSMPTSIVSSRRSTSPSV